VTFVLFPGEDGNFLYFSDSMYMSTYTYVYMCMYTYVCMYINICIYIYMVLSFLSMCVGCPVGDSCFVSR